MTSEAAEDELALVRGLLREARAELEHLRKVEAAARTLVVVVLAAEAELGVPQTLALDALAAALTTR